jgi:hypothetical protein
MLVMWPADHVIAATSAVVFHALCIPHSSTHVLQAAYNWALAAYQAYGKDHPETKAALAATKAADPESWVPRLLAGLTFPPPSMAPASVPGSKMEAAVSQPLQEGRRAQRSRGLRARARQCAQGS